MFKNKTKSHIATPRKKNVIYTAISNGYDRLFDLSNKSTSFKYICYIDNYLLNTLINNTIWELRPFPDYISNLDHARRNRFIKLHPHILFPEHEKSIYIDGNIDIITDPSDILNIDSINCLKHSERNCIYDEGDECIRIQKAPELQIRNQLKRYRQEGYPVNNGLIEGNIIIRNHHNPAVITLMEYWWKEILENTARDQLSFPYASWKTGIPYEIMENENPKSLNNNSHFNLRKNIGHTGHINQNTNTINYLKSLYDVYIGWRLNNRK